MPHTLNTPGDAAPATYTLKIHPDDAEATFPDMRAAIDALSAFEDAAKGRFQYELRAVYVGGERRYDGVMVRAMDTDGFGAGYIVREPEADRLGK